MLYTLSGLSSAFSSLRLGYDSKFCVYSLLHFVPLIFWAFLLLSVAIFNLVIDWKHENYSKFQPNEECSQLTFGFQVKNLTYHIEFSNAPSWNFSNFQPIHVQSNRMTYVIEYPYARVSVFFQVFCIIIWNLMVCLKNFLGESYIFSIRYLYF